MIRNHDPLPVQTGSKFAANPGSEIQIALGNRHVKFRFIGALFALAR